MWQGELFSLHMTHQHIVNMQTHSERNMRTGAGGSSWRPGASPAAVNVAGGEFFLFLSLTPPTFILSVQGTEQKTFHYQARLSDL